MSTKKFERFWHGELPPDLRTPNEPYIAVLAWEKQTDGWGEIGSYFMTPTRLSKRTIEPKLLSLPPAQLFELLRFANLAEGFFSVEGILHYPPLFDAGGMECDTGTRLRLAEPEYGHASEVAAMRGRHDWVTLPGLRTDGRLLLQVGPRKADLLPAGGWGSKSAAEVRREISKNHVVRLERGLTAESPTMLIDVAFSWRPPHLRALDLLAYNGCDIREHSFVERQRVLEQEIAEMRGNGLAAEALMRWTEGRLDASDGIVMAAAGSPYGADLISDRNGPA